MTIDIAFVGYGEVGTTFARDLLANGARSVSALAVACCCRTPAASPFFIGTMVGRPAPAR